MKRSIWILWPSFVVAAAAQALFFTAFDPDALEAVSLPSNLSGTAAHSIVFLFVWLVGAASSAFTCFLQRTAGEVNGCPFEPDQRPPGCPADSARSIRL